MPNPDDDGRLAPGGGLNDWAANYPPRRGFNTVFFSIGHRTMFPPAFAKPGDGGPAYDDDDYLNIHLKFYWNTDPATGWTQDLYLRQAADIAAIDSINYANRSIQHGTRVVFEVPANELWRVHRDTSLKDNPDGTPPDPDENPYLWPKYKEKWIWVERFFNIVFNDGSFNVLNPPLDGYGGVLRILDTTKLAGILAEDEPEGADHRFDRGKIGDAEADPTVTGGLISPVPTYTGSTGHDWRVNRPNANPNSTPGYTPPAEYHDRTVQLLEGLYQCFYGVMAEMRLASRGYKVYINFSGIIFPDLAGYAPAGVDPFTYPGYNPYINPDNPGEAPRAYPGGDTSALLLRAENFHNCADIFSLDYYTYITKPEGVPPPLPTDTHYRAYGVRPEDPVEQLRRLGMLIVEVNTVPDPANGGTRVTRESEPGYKPVFLFGQAWGGAPIYPDTIGYDTSFRPITRSDGSSHGPATWDWPNAQPYWQDDSNPTGAPWPGELGQRSGKYAADRGGYIDDPSFTIPDDPHYDGTPRYRVSLRILEIPEIRFDLFGSVFFGAHGIAWFEQIKCPDRVINDRYVAVTREFLDVADLRYNSIDLTKKVTARAARPTPSPADTRVSLPLKGALVARKGTDPADLFLFLVNPSSQICVVTLFFGAPSDPHTLPSPYRGRVLRLYELNDPTPVPGSMPLTLDNIALVEVPARGVQIWRSRPPSYTYPPPGGG